MWRFLSRSKRSEKTTAAARKVRHKFNPGSDPALESRELLASVVFHPLAASTGGVVNLATVRGRITHNAIVTVVRGSAGGTIFGVTSHQGTGRTSTPNTTLVNGGRTVTTGSPAVQFSPFSTPTFINSTNQTTTSTSTTSSFTTTTSTTVPFGTLGTASNGQPVVFV